MPLSMAKSGESCTIRRITGKDSVRRHLSELGFVLGEEVKVVNEVAGSMILQVKGTRIALGKDMANRIHI